MKYVEIKNGIVIRVVEDIHGITIYPEGKRLTHGAGSIDIQTNDYLILEDERKVHPGMVASENMREEDDSSRFIDLSMYDVREDISEEIEEAKEEIKDFIKQDHKDE